MAASELEIRALPPCRAGRSGPPGDRRRARRLGSVAGRTASTASGSSRTCLAHHLDVLEQVGIDQSDPIQRRRPPPLRPPRPTALTSSARQRVARPERRCSCAPATRRAASSPPRCGARSPARQPSRPARIPPIAIHPGAVAAARRAELTSRRRTAIDRPTSTPAATGRHRLRPGARGARPSDELAALVDPRPGAGRDRSRVRRHGRRAAPPHRSARRRIEPAMSRARRRPARRRSRDRHRCAATRPDPPPRRRGARHRVPDHRRDRLGDHGQPALARRRRPAAPGERGRDRRRADRADPDVRRRVRRPLQPGRDPRRPLLGHADDPRQPPATSSPRSSAAASARSSPT